MRAASRFKCVFPERSRHLIHSRYLEVQPQSDINGFGFRNQSWCNGNENTCAIHCRLLQVEKSLSLSKTVAPGQACLALIGAQNNLEDIPVRVPRFRAESRQENWEKGAKFQEDCFS